MTPTDYRARPTALLDACALVPLRLTNVLLWLAEGGLFEVLWSEQILDEVERTLPKLGIGPERAARRVAAMRHAFGPAALVEGYEPLVPAMTCDPKDRHVFAAAVHGGADYLVTFNLKDFPPASNANHDVVVIHPDLFLVALLLDRPLDALEALERGVRDLHSPPQTLRQLLASLTLTVPNFAHQAADMAAQPPQTIEETPVLVVENDDEALAGFGERGDLTNPAQVALIWTAGLTSDLELARALTFDPTAWGDYQWATDLVTSRSLASKVMPAVDAPTRIAFMRFIPEVATPAQIFSDFRISACILTLVRLPDGTWRVWGLGPHMPSAVDVLGEEDALDTFEPGGGTALVLQWLEHLVDPSPPRDVMWGSLDDPVRLAHAQAWLIGSGGYATPYRDEEARHLAEPESTHPSFDSLYAHLIEHWRSVYGTINGEPCLVGVTETVGVDLELVVVTSNEYVGSRSQGEGILAHTFITRHLGERRWVIAAQARRLPVPGWPPTERDIPGLLIDGHHDAV